MKGSNLKIGFSHLGVLSLYSVGTDLGLCCEILTASWLLTPTSCAQVGEFNGKNLGTGFNCSMDFTGQLPRAQQLQAYLPAVQVYRCGADGRSFS